MSGQEGKAFRFFTQQHGCQIAVSQSYLTVIGNRTGDAKSLQTFTNGFGDIISGLIAFRNGNRRSDNICPAGIFKTDRLNAFYDLIDIHTQIIHYLFCFFD